ncbi:peptide chain release factor N(5)-glutamine methyltransferase [Parahalioglobus pacificus]|uniref:Release factor glutamine methyltransferase n=1 Tax=Parahalioglobus pacificus TaxID=930806 RepID=A0A918XD76_9GAMM|nr:peptide chain release factor N(5)-glutamine methyltransferase [Halioglobus pacificus]GHD25675.1 release factor glutamine methyltransferase [Halioglobus pacificus]
MATVKSLLDAGSDLPGESALRDAEILLCHCIDRTRTYLYTWPEESVDAQAAAQYMGLLERRRDGEPIAYITGKREFWSLELAVNPHTLIPRPETETLVEWALQLALPAQAEVLDLGTGSGAIALALASERRAWTVHAVDNSEGAVACALSNAQRLALANVSCKRSDWFAALGNQRYHLIVANPPYVSPGDPHLAQGDLRFEPASALAADNAGLADLEHIVVKSPNYLQSNGWLLLEHGYDQAAAVEDMLSARGFCDVSTRADLAGQARITGGRYAG